MFEQLTEEEERVFKWIAEQCGQSKSYASFDEARQALHIATNEAIKAILQRLQRGWLRGVVQDVYYGSAMSEPDYCFEISPLAAAEWSQYERAKQQSKCLTCGKPALEELGPVYRYRCSECGAEVDRLKP